MQNRILNIVKEHFGVDKVTPETTAQDLGADMLDRVELIESLENEFEITVVDSEIDQWSTISDLTRLIISYRP